MNKKKKEIEEMKEKMKNQRTPSEVWEQLKYMKEFYNRKEKEEYGYLTQSQAFFSLVSDAVQEYFQTKAPTGAKSLSLTLTPDWNLGLKGDGKHLQGVVLEAYIPFKFIVLI